MRTFIKIDSLCVCVCKMDLDTILVKVLISVQLPHFVEHTRTRTHAHAHTHVHTRTYTRVRYYYTQVTVYIPSAKVFIISYKWLSLVEWIIISTMTFNDTDFKSTDAQIIWQVSFDSYHLHKICYFIRWSVNDLKHSCRERAEFNAVGILRELSNYHCLSVNGQLKF